MKEILALIFSLIGVAFFIGVPTAFIGFAFVLGFGLGYGVV